MASPASTPRSLFKSLAGPAVLVAMIVMALSQSLFSGGKLAPTAADSDLQAYFLAYRYFAFHNWAHGHFPLWNPHVFCGLPFFAQMQSNLLYPICWIYFFLSTAVGANVEMTIHLCIAALGTYAWARQRGISRPGATLAGAAYAFSGQVYLRVMAGHLSPLATISWIPLVFLAIDRLIAMRFLSGILIGALAVCLQLLGGYPQCGYYAAIVGGVYLLLESIDLNRRDIPSEQATVLSPRPVPRERARVRAFMVLSESALTPALSRSTGRGGKSRIRLYAAFLAMYALGGMLAAAQMIPALRASALSIRAGGTTYQFSSTFALSPENLLFLFIPYPFGDLKHIPYVGRWYLWEMSIYAGLLTLALACIAIRYRPKPSRWRTIVLLLIVIVLMLGPATPVHKLLYYFLPGFHMFRGASKFGTVWTLLISMLAAEGFDQLRLRIPGTRMIQIAMAAALVFLGVGAALAADSSAKFFHTILHRIGQHGQFTLLDRLNARPDLIVTLNHWLSVQGLLAGGLLLALGILLYARRFSISAAYVILVLTIAEVHFAAGFSTMATPAVCPTVAEWQSPIAQATAANQRVLFTDSDQYDNSGAFYGYDSLWGYDPGQPKRYTKLIETSQGKASLPEDQYTGGMSFRQLSPILSLLRCRYVFQAAPIRRMIEVAHPLPRLLLIGHYEKMADSTAIAARLADPAFNARQSVILETDPLIAPAATGTRGKAEIVRESINDVEIHADLPAPAVLLITDAYDPGWHVRAMDSSAGYQLFQADDVLRAIPLSAGSHHFDLYYTPPGLLAGICASAAGVILWLAAMIFALRRKRVGVADADHLH